MDLTAITSFLKDNVAALIVTGSVSLLALVGTAVVLPWLLVKIPPDYFVRKKRSRSRLRDRHPVMGLLVVIFRNFIGLIFVLSGIAMLLTPGQGLLTILIGFVIMDFPGKYRMQRWIISRGSVRRSINWLRRKAGAQELIEQAEEPVS